MNPHTRTLSVLFLATLSMVFSQTACTNPKNDSSSDVTGLTLFAGEGDFTRQRVEHVDKDIGFSKIIYGGTPAEVYSTLGYASELPDEDLNFLVSQPGFHIQLDAAPISTDAYGNPAITGITPRDGFTLIPHVVKVFKSLFGMRESMVHELCHAVEGYVLVSHGYRASYYGQVVPSQAGFEYVDNTRLAAAYDSVEGRHLADYPKTNNTEYFAEACHQWYASKRSRRLMNLFFPVSRRFARKMFLPSPYFRDKDEPQLTKSGKSSSSRAATEPQGNALPIAAAPAAAAASATASSSIAMGEDSSIAAGSPSACYCGWAAVPSTSKQLLSRLSSQQGFRSHNVCAAWKPGDARIRAWLEEFPGDCDVNTCATYFPQETETKQACSSYVQVGSPSAPAEAPAAASDPLPQG